MMQSPWLFFSPALPPFPSPVNCGNGTKAPLVPLTLPPAPHPLLSPNPTPFPTFPCTHHPSHLLMAAAAGVYGHCPTLIPPIPQPNVQTNHHYKLHGKMDDGNNRLLQGKRKSGSDDVSEHGLTRDIKKAKLETKALKAKRPGFTDERYNETSYFVENGLRKVYPYYFTFTTFTKGRWVGEKILDVFAREFRAHPVEEYERCIKSGTLTVNYTKVDTDYRLKHNDLLANIVHRHEVPVTADPIEVIYQDEDLVVVNKPASIPVHPCGRYRHNTVVFILAKEHQLKNLRTIHRLDRLTSGLLLFGKSPKKAREMEHQIRNRLVQKEYLCRVEGNFPDGEIECHEPIEVVSYKIGVCKVSKEGKECRTVFQKLSFNGKTSVVVARPRTGRMHQIRVHLQFLGYPIVNDPLYNHPVFGPEKGKNGITGKSDQQLIAELISIHNAENWLGVEGDDGNSESTGLFSGTASSSSCSSLQNESSTLSNPDVPTSPTSSNLIINGTIDRGIRTFPEMTVTDGKSFEVKSSKVTVGTQTSSEEPTSQSNSSNTSSVCASFESCTSSIKQVDVETPPSSSLLVEGEKALPSSLRIDPHCYECKVKFRDPKPKDLVMYLHALTYRGPGWCYETKYPEWAKSDWAECTITKDEENL